MKLPGIHFIYARSYSPLLPSRIENNALRIAQEALTNAINHADPKHIIIELDFEAAKEGISSATNAHPTGY